MALGIQVSDACKSIYEQIKNGESHRYAIFYISRDGRVIDLEAVGDPTAGYEQFLTAIQAGGPQECRYGLYDFEYQCEGSKKKLFLMIWCPDTSNVRNKMVYASSLGAVKEAMVGVQNYIEAFNLLEVSQETVREKLRASDC